MNSTPVRLLLAVAVLAALALPALAADPPAPAQAAAAGDGQVTINLAGVNLHALVEYVSRVTGKPVLLPDRFPGDRAVDVISTGRGTMSKSKAMEIISTALQGAGYAIIEKPDYIQIVQQGSIEGVPLTGKTGQPAIGPHALMTTVVEVKNADATKLAPILTALKSKSGSIQVYPDANKIIITEQGAQLQTMLELIKTLDTRWSENTSVIYKLKNTSLESMQSVVSAYVKTMMQTAEPLVQKRLQSLTVHPHSTTNSFVLFGHPDDIARVQELIRSLDVSPAEASRTYHTYFVLNRDAAELVSVLNNIFAAQKARATTADVPPVVIADATNAAVVVVAAPDKFNEILALIKKLDKPKAQVQIESALIEMSTNKMMDLGIELATTDGPGPGVRGFAGTTFGMSSITESGRVPIAPANGGVVAGVFKGAAGAIPFLIEMSQYDEGISFIASPRLVASDNKKATVKISEQREYLKSIITPEGRTSEVTHGGYLDAGVTLEITPHINEEGTVRLEISQTTEQFLPSTQTANGPLTNKASRMAQTEVLVPNGTTVVIAGLTRTVESKTVQKIPYLGDIPLLGFFFRRTSTTNEQRNLCIFITPTILRTPEALTAETDKRRTQMKQIGDPKKGGVPVPEKTLDEVTGSKDRPANP